MSQQNCFQRPVLEWSFIVGTKECNLCKVLPFLSRIPPFHAVLGLLTTSLFNKPTNPHPFIPRSFTNNRILLGVLQAGEYYIFAFKEVDEDGNRKWCSYSGRRPLGE